MCLAQLYLQSGSEYQCVSELGELGLVEFRDVSIFCDAFKKKNWYRWSGVWGPERRQSGAWEP